MQTLDHDHPPATPDDFTILAEHEDRARAAELLRARVMPTLNREIAIGIAHAIVGALNTDALDEILRGGAP